MNNYSRTFAILYFLIVGFSYQLAFADHGGSYHSDFGLVVPASNSTGNYSVTWTAGTYDVTLEEKLNGGAYAAAYYGSANANSFTGKASGTYTYRIKFIVCYYSCQTFYSAPKSIVVTAPPTPEAIFSSLEDLVQTEFEEWMASQGATTQQRITAESDIRALANTILQRDANRGTEDELVVIYKIRILQKYDPDFQQGALPSELYDLLEQYNFASEFDLRGLPGVGQ